jgi:hypothetical protein
VGHVQLLNENTINTNMHTQTHTCTQTEKTCTHSQTYTHTQKENVHKDCFILDIQCSNLSQTKKTRKKEKRRKKIASLSVNTDYYHKSTKTIRTRVFC